MPAQETVRFCITVVLLLILFAVGVALMHSAMLMAMPHLKEEKVDKATLQISSKGTLAVMVPPINAMDANAVRQALDGVCIAADFRQLLLLNQYTQLAVFLACAFAFGTLVAYPMSGRLLTIVPLLLIVLLSQAPYHIGQTRAHRTVLARCVGVTREELRQRLVSLSPAMPPLQSWFGLLASSGAGGFLATMLSKTLTGLVFSNP